MRRMPSGTTPGARRRVVAEDHPVEGARLAGEADRVQRGAAVPAVDDLDRHLAGDELLDVLVGERGRAAVDVADDVGSRLEHDVRPDGAAIPAMDGPPVWNVETMPCCRAQASIGAASAPVLTEPRPTSPTRLTPASASSAKSCSSRPSSRIGAPAWTLTPAGRTLANGANGDDRERLEADDVLGAPGQVDLARRDHRRHAAVELGLDEVGRALARRPVAEHGMDVGVDQARERGRALAVDDDVRVLVDAAPTA